MAPPSKSWSSRIRSLAPRIYFILIIFQVPLFRVPCRAGICTSPVQVTASQLIAHEVFPSYVVKALLYPGAVAHGFITNMTIPGWGQIFDIYNLTVSKNASAEVGVQRIEVLAGSYFAVAGGVAGLLNPGRMSMFGTLLLVWGLMKDKILGRAETTDPAKAAYVYPTILIALICAVFSVKYNFNKATNGTSQRQQIAKPLRSSAKSKLR